MYIYALEYLKDFVIAAKKALVVGTGGGFMAACFGEMMKEKDSKVYMIDQIKPIVDVSFDNISRGNLHLI